jgi:hypothetical protein
MAVVVALEAAGAHVAGFDLFTDEDRRLCLTLAAGPDGPGGRGRHPALRAGRFIEQ